MKTQSTYQILQFDSKLFEFKVAKILVPNLNTQELRKILYKLQGYGVKLVYWTCDPNDKDSIFAANELLGFLGSKQITYYTKHNNLDLQIPSSAFVIEEYNGKRPTVDLNLLAFQAGSFSHFKTDKKFSEELFFRLYKKWMANCVNRSAADKIYIAKQKQEIVGMITVGEKKGRGDIGLLAVKEDVRRCKLGESLIKTAQTYFIGAGLLDSQVVTQQANLAACHLYEKCGYKVEKIENFYHFWL